MAEYATTAHMSQYEQRVNAQFAEFSETVKQRLAAAVQSGVDFRALVFVPTIDAAYCMQQALVRL